MLMHGGATYGGHVSYVTDEREVIALARKSLCEAASTKNRP